MNTVLIVALLSLSQSPDADARAAIALAQSQAPKPPVAPPIAVEKVAPPKAVKSYAEYRTEAIGKNLPIVIFVRCQDRPIAGAVTVRVDHLAGYDSGPNIVIGVPDAGVGMRWKATLERDASDAAIRREIGGSTQSMRLAPFVPVSRANC